MQFTTIFRTLLLSLLAVPALSSPHKGHNGPNPYYTTNAYREELIKKYLQAGAGNYSVMPEIFQENVQLIQDRNCITNGTIQFSITNRTAYATYVKEYTAGFSNVTFTTRYWLAMDYMLTLQWTGHFTVGPDIQKYDPYATAQEGHVVNYNGTDTVFINKTTGLIYQDDLFFNHNSNQYQLGWKLAYMQNLPNVPGACPTESGAPSCADVLTYP